MFGKDQCHHNKLIKWMNVESAKIKQINLSKNYRQNIILIRDQITSEKVSLSYFLEYIMKDYLENKKKIHSKAS